MLKACEGAIGNEAGERVGRDIGLGTLTPVAKLMTCWGALPAALAARTSRRYLNESVLLELAEVKRAGRRRLANNLGGFGGAYRAVDGEYLQQGEANRVGEGSHR